MSEIRLKPLIHQYEFLNSKNTHTGLVAGFGAGKSFAGVLKTIYKHTQELTNVAYYLPTYPLIRDIAFPKFNELLDLMQIDYRLNRTDKEYHTECGKIILRSMDNPDLIVGYEVGYSLIDEADVLSKSKMEDVFIKVLARNRANKEKNCLDFVSTPEGFSFLYDFFINNPSESKRLIKAKTMDNPYLPKDYINSLREQYDAQQLEAYLNGEFVNLNSGSVYPDYDRQKCNTDRILRDTDTLHIGMDFNITKMSAVIVVLENGLPYVVDELTNVYDTEQMCNLIKQKYSNKQINIYADASGNNRRSAGKSDFQIIQNYRLNLIKRAKNPKVKDRINSVNKLFRDGAKININQCINLVQALEQIGFKNGEPDKTSGLDHITDALGYVFYSLSNFVTQKVRTF